MDFFKIGTKELKNGKIEVYPDFQVGRSKDLMVQGRSFYAIWDEKKGLWSRDEYDVQRLVDEELYKFADSNPGTFVVKSMISFGSNSWSNFRKFVNNVSDNSQQLDSNLCFANTEVKKSDYVSRRLPYSLESGDYSAWDELIGTLYSVEERAKIEWAIGAIVSGDSKKIQKFLVLYGPAGTGKSTVLNIIEKLFSGYTTTFEAKALGSNNNSFSTEVFKGNPLVAIQHDGDLSKIEDNTKLNSIVSHEEMTMNEKFKSAYTSRINAFLFMGTNQPVKISDAKSGIIRRLIDVRPTGVKIPPNHYEVLMSKIDFELGAIAKHCLDVYKDMGKNYYNSYRPVEMMFQTDIFFNFIEAHYDIFSQNERTTLKQAYSLYKEFCSDTGIDKILPQYKFREELRNYFDDFKDKVMVNEEVLRSVYFGFNADKFKMPTNDPHTYSLVLDETESIFDDLYANQQAQYTKDDESPLMVWRSVRTILHDLDTSKLHYVKLPENHIVIDFDLKDSNGEKSLDRNLEAASNWPSTYAELSKSRNGVHLHYIYDGDVSRLRNYYSEGIEVKVYRGNASLRRKLSKCNNVPIATINSGLPLKEKKVINESTVKSEKSLRDLIERNLKKEIHPGTKPSIDFIHKILEDAYESTLVYDISDMRARIIAFANNSTHQPMQCLKIVQDMKFASAKEEAPLDALTESKLVFFDVEVYPNLFVVCWKYEGDKTVVKMINPTSEEIEQLLAMKLVGFNNRRYDNHILYARVMGYTNEDLYKLSQKIINGNVGAMFGGAYNLSYTDIYDFSSKKQSLKKFEIELKIPHIELDIPWDQDVPPEYIDKVVEYCVNDVKATEKVFEDRKQDFVARLILCELSGLTPNHTTQQHTSKIIFGDNKRPQESFVYTDLSVDFPGYVFDAGQSTYKGEITGEGGYVYAEPGIYKNVAVLDVASMHPTSIEQLNLFGEYTDKFGELKEARLAIKHRDYKKAETLLNGKLKPYLGNDEESENLSYALKIIINIVYGLTSAKFDNAFRDPRNKDNIVAKRGALFMIDLKEFVQSQGYTVAHIKTDSIKIPDATEDIIQMVKDFGISYGYEFEHEITYDKIALVNDAVYIACKDDKWDAVGAQFQHPYVFKTLFTGEKLEWDDFCETKQVTQGVMYLDINYDVPMALLDKENEHSMVFIGRVGRFVPVKEQKGAGVLYRVKEGKAYAVAGTKNYLWMEADVAKTVKAELDYSYFENLAYDAKKAIDKFGSYYDFINN